MVDARAAQPAAPFLLRSGAISKPGKPAQREGVDAEQLGSELVLHVAAHALNDGDDGDQEHHADADAEQREEAFQLVNADLRQSEPNCLDERHAYDFLERSGGAIPADFINVARLSSLEINPSRRTITRRA